MKKEKEKETKSLGGSLTNQDEHNGRQGDVCKTS